MPDDLYSHLGDTPPPPRPIERVTLPRGTDPSIIRHLEGWLVGQNMLRARGEANSQTWFEVQTADDAQAMRFLRIWGEITRTITGRPPLSRN